MHSFKILLLSFLVVGSTFAQDAEDFDDTVYDDINPKHQFTLLLGLPNGTTNKPFSSIISKFLVYGVMTRPNDPELSKNSTVKGSPLALRKAPSR